MLAFFGAGMAADTAAADGEGTDPSGAELIADHFARVNRKPSVTERNALIRLIRVSQ